jgi:hypothetical protein
MKCKVYSCSFITFLSLLFLNPAFSQDWRIEKTLSAGDSLSFASLRLSADDQGVAAIDQAARVKWTIPVPGLVLGMGKWNGNPVAFYTLQHKDQVFKQIKEIHALVVAIKQRKSSKTRLSIPMTANILSCRS